MDIVEQTDSQTLVDTVEKVFRSEDKRKDTLLKATTAKHRRSVINFGDLEALGSESSKICLPQCYLPIRIDCV